MYFLDGETQKNQCPPCSKCQVIGCTNYWVRTCFKCEVRLCSSHAQCIKPDDYRQPCTNAKGCQLGALAAAIKNAKNPEATKEAEAALSGERTTRAIKISHAVLETRAGEILRNHRWHYK